MKRVSRPSRSEVIKILKAGGIGVLATDTLYGLVGRAFDRKAVERIYKVRKRNPLKPLIILIASPRDLKKFGIALDASMKRVLRKLWPGKVSIVLPCPQKKFAYLHRGTGTLAFRMPRAKKLQEILKKTGPLVAPSANPEGLSPARTLKGARHYFGDAVDFYVNSGKREGRPSALISFTSGRVEILREGAVSVVKLLNQ